MKKSILVASALIASACIFGQKVSGKLNFKPGQQIEMTSSVNSVVTQEAMGQTIEFNINGEVAQTYSVASSANGNTTITQKPKRLYLKFDGMGQSKALDSDKPEDLNSDMGAPLKEALAKNYEMTLDAAGKVISVKTTQQKETDRSGGDMIGNLLSQVGSALDIPKEGAASIFKVLPDKEVSKGESWSDSSSSADGKTSTIYTLTDVTDSELLVDFKSNATTETKAEMMGMETLTKMKHVTTGKIILDKASGIMKQRTSTTEATGTVDVMGQSVPLTSKSTTVINIK